MTQFTFMARVPDRSATRGAAPKGTRIENTEQSKTFTLLELIASLVISLSIGILIGVYLDDIAELLTPLLPYSPFCLIVLGVLIMSLAFYGDPESGFAERLWRGFAFIMVLLMAVNDLIAASTLAVIITVLFILASDPVAMSLEEQPRTAARERRVEYLKQTFLARGCTALALFVIAYLLLWMGIGELTAGCAASTRDALDQRATGDSTPACQLFDYLRDLEKYVGC